MSLSRLEADVVVVGGGVVGLAVAAVLARAGRKVTLLERGTRLAEGISARNSGVVHAGIQAPAGALKARLCVRGRQLLYERAEAHGVPYAKLGKLIVATADEEVPPLLGLRERAERSGVELDLLDAERVRQLEPRLRAVAALWSRESGIVDAAALAFDYAREARAHGAEILLRHELFAVEPSGARVRLGVRAPGEDFELRAAWVINAAGLDAVRIAELSGLNVQARGLRLYPCKGDYFRLGGRFAQAVTRLVYPLPGAAGLGIHLTLDLAGGLRAGPDATYVDELDYSVDEARAEHFAGALGRYLPGISAEDLSPDFSGIRPKLQGPGQAFVDFTIESGAAEGMPGLFHLLGIESPGLTASEAIGEYVLELGRAAGL